MNAGARVAVIGGGWAGLACALALRRLGPRLDLFDASPLWGGRARAARVRLAGETVTLDCGQHLLVGAYRACLAQLDELGADGPARLVRRRLRLASPSGLDLRRLRLPGQAGLAAGLLLARGLSPAEKFAAIRLMAGLRAAGWRPPPGILTASALLEAWGQPRRLVRRLWEPLCVGALNTPAEEACATSFAAVLRDTLGAERAASDFVLPETTLDAAITRPALGWLRAHGGAVSFGTNVRAVRRAGPHWRIETAGATLEASQLVVATPPADAARLLEPLDPRAQALARFTYEPIATVLLEWPRDALLPLPDWTLLHDDGRRAWGQWLFDRGCIGAHRIAAVVVSAASRLGATTREALGEAVAHQVARQLELPLPRAHRTVIERRATIRCTPDRPRIACDAFADALPGLWLAGDYVDDEYPATLETAVRSGRRAAERARAAQPQAASSA